MQKNLTLFFLAFSLALLVLGGCNRSKSLEVKDIKMISYQLSGLESNEECLLIKKTLLELKGVTAAAVNFKSYIAAVIYYPDETNERKIKNVLAQTPGLVVADHQLKANPNKAKCPMKAASSWFSFNSK